MVVLRSGEPALSQAERGPLFDFDTAGCRSLGFGGWDLCSLSAFLFRCHPDRSNPTFSSHPGETGMVGLRSGGTSLRFFPFAIP